MLEAGVVHVLQRRAGAGHGGPVWPGAVLGACGATAGTLGGYRARTYRVEPVAVAGEPETKEAMAPAWLEAGGVTLGGRSLAEVGLSLPVLRPEQALLLHVRGA